MIKDFLKNSIGFHTKRKIVVIQSDDWGSLRMPSKNVFNLLAKDISIKVDDPYNKYDTLESEDDLNALYEILRLYRDKWGRHPVITTNFVVANPDFEQIKGAGYKKYYFESIEKTYERLNRKSSLEIIRQGIESNLVEPQFHGREHVNIAFWIDQLQAGHHEVRKAFDHQVFGASFKGLGLSKGNFQASWDYKNTFQENIVNESIHSGLRIFKDTFGFESKSTIAPAYTWGNSSEKVLKENNVSFIQTIYTRKRPVGESPKLDFNFYYTGRTNSNRQIYLTRNAFFERSHSKRWDSHSCILEIEKAFKFNKPAIISTHRVNFIGTLNEENRRNNLKEFSHILREITTRWPEVEFLKTTELAQIIQTN